MRDCSECPWTDFKGGAIHVGDFIKHPFGEVGRVIIVDDAMDDADRWRVDYGDGLECRLCLQVGDKGRAVVL